MWWPATLFTWRGDEGPGTDPTGATVVPADATQESGGGGAPVDWASLPPGLWQRCLQALPPASHSDCHAALCASRTLASAVLHASPTPSLHWETEEDEQEDVEGLVRSVRLLQRLWDASGPPAPPRQQEHEPRDFKGALLRLSCTTESYSYKPSASWLTALRGVHLPCVTRLDVEGFDLPGVWPPDLAAALPHVRELCLRRCKAGPPAADAAPAAPAAHLQRLELTNCPFNGGLEHLVRQGVPRLTALRCTSTATLAAAVPLLSGQLTELMAFNPYGAGELEPARRGREALMRAVGGCTRLRVLGLPSLQPADLPLLAPALRGLQQLHISSEMPRVEDGDAILDALLAGATQLTSLHWEDASSLTFRRSHAGRPCTWRRLSFRCVAPHQLACLPLHSLTSPVTWRHFYVKAVEVPRGDAALHNQDGGWDALAWEPRQWAEARALRAQVLAAAGNVRQRCRAGVAWDGGGGRMAAIRFLELPEPPGDWEDDEEQWEDEDEEEIEDGFREVSSVMLGALQPLLPPAAVGPPLTELCVADVVWSGSKAELLRLLLPPGCRKLRLREGVLEPEDAPRLALAQPSLVRLELDDVVVEPRAVIALVNSLWIWWGAHAAVEANTLLDGLRGVRPRVPLRRLVVSPRRYHGDPPDVAAWSVVLYQIERLGLRVRATVPTLENLRE